MAGDSQNHIEYVGKRLSPATTYQWRVRVWDSADNVSDWSELATFTTGLFTNADWQGAHWIKRDNNDPDDYTYFHKRFLLQCGDVQQAMLYVAAVHQFEVTLNGAVVGKWSSYHYPQFQYYKAFDITEYLRDENELTVLTHWFGGGQGRPASARGLILKAIITLHDGQTIHINSDDSWHCRRAEQWQQGQPLRHDHEGVGYVEAIEDLRCTIDDLRWLPVAVIGEHPIAPWTATLRPDLTQIVEYEIVPERIWRREDGATMVDLGAVYAGRPKITFSGTGQTTILAGYTLNPDDTINEFHNQGTDMRYFAHGNGDGFAFLPLEMLGMRYFEIRGELSAENILFIVRHTELDDSRSTFTTSDDQLNAVWHFLKRSIPVAAQEQFLDTPTREKGGFLVDSLNESLVAMAAYGERKLTRRALHEFLDSQTQYWPDGRLNAVYPNGDGVRDIPDFTQAFLVWVWHYYMQTGDMIFLRANYAQLKAVADYVLRHRNATTGLIHDLTGGDGGPYHHGIIDWPPTMRYGYDMQTVARTVVNCYAYADFDIMAKIADAVGEMADAANFRNHADQLRIAINDKLITANNRYCDGLRHDGSQCDHAGQQANTFPLALGITPENGKRSVYAHIKARKMNSGMPTVYYLMRAVGEMGDGEHLLDLYTRADWDGWANNMAKGATCTWEGWDSDQRVAQSLSHPWGAIGLLGLQAYVLGVQPLAPQFARVQIKPLDFGDRLTHARGTIPTERGDIVIAWQRDGETFTIEVTLPVGISAEISLPNTQTRSIGSGKHQFTY